MRTYRAMPRTALGPDRGPAVLIPLAWVLSGLAVLLLIVPVQAKSRRHTGRVAGSVTDVRTGEPIPAAVITIERYERAVLTTPSGEFQVDSVRAGKSRVVIEATGYAPYRRSIVVREGQNIRLDAALDKETLSAVADCDTCAPPAVLLGKVVDTMGGAVRGARVVLLDMNREVTTAADGTFGFPGIGQGKHQLAVMAPEHKSDTLSDLSVSAGKALALTVVLHPSKTLAEITGVVTGMVVSSSGGTSVPQAMVSILNTDYTCLTDSSGRFEIADLPPGAVSLLATKWGYEAQVTSGVEVVAGTRTTQDLVLQARAVGAFAEGGAVGGLAGVVSTEEGQPVANATVVLVDSGKTTHSDFVGRYSFDSLSSGVYAVVAHAEGYDTAAPVDIDVWPGEVSSANISLTKTLVVSDDSLVPSPDFGLFTGIVVDAEKGEPVAGAEIVVKGARGTKGVTDLTGRYVVRDVPEGVYVLEISHAQYDGQITSGVAARKGTRTVTDYVLTASGISQMAKMSVRAVATRNTGAALLKERQAAISFTDAIGSQEMSRTGASTAADAMKSVTGATVVGGKYVLIRGLPERYTITTLNGSMLPSSDPDKQAVNMDLFPAGVIENITVHKTFTPNLPGGWAGGVVDIRTKPFPEDLVLTVGASAGINDQATFNDGYLTYRGGDLDWLGFDDGTRELAGVFGEYDKEDVEALYLAANANITGSYGAARLSNPDDHLMDSLLAMTELAQALDTVVLPYTDAPPPDQSYSFTIGNTVNLFDRPLGFLVGISYKNKYSLSLDDAQREYEFSAWQDSADNEPSLYDDFTITDAKNTVLWGGLANVAFDVNADHHVDVQYMYTRNTTDRVKQVMGVNGYYRDDGTYTFRRLQFIERSVNYVQPNGRHRLTFGEQPLDIEWRAAFTSTNQDEPDTRDSYHFQKSTNYSLIPNLGDADHKWRTLEERVYELNAAVLLPFYQWTGDSATAQVGGGWTGTRREVRERKYVYDLQNYYGRSGTTLPESEISCENMGLLEDSTSQSGYDLGLLIKDESDPRKQFDGELDIFSAYGMLELPLVERFVATLGLRYERTTMYGASIEEEVSSDSTVARMDNHDFLPALSLNFALLDNMNVRGAYSRTLLRPSMREKSPYKIEDFFGGPSFLGNQNVERFLVDNVDLRWEWFMKPGEILALSAFYKHVQEPIEVAFTINDIRTPINTSTDASLLGLEVEARKTLDFSWAPSWLAYFQLAGNFTYAYSRVDLNEDMRRNETYFPGEPTYRRFQGQSPYVVNLFFTFNQPDWGTDINLLYNVFGERLAELNDAEYPWVWEQPFHSLNLTAKQSIGTHVTLSARLGNILGDTRREVHYYDGREYLVEEHKPGRTYSLGVKYSF